MRHHFRAAALALSLVAAGCTNGGVDPSGLAPLTSEQARSIAPPPPGAGMDIPPPAVPASAQPAPLQSAAAQPVYAQPAAPPAAAPSPAAAAPAPAAQAASLASARIEFAPVVGAAPDKVRPLAARLTARAAQRDIGVASAGAAGATHVLKGYFSAFTDNRETTVIYVWDVLDPSGNRLHRIQGQQKVSGGKGQGWDAVDPAAMEAIADRTIDDLAVWLGGGTG